MTERVLVRTTNWVGDLVMSIPALAAIRRAHPDARICALVRPPLHELLIGSPYVDEFILMDRKGVHRGLSGMAKLVNEVRGHNFDRAYLLQNAFEAALIAFMSKIPERIGYSRDGRGILLTKAIKILPETRKKHQVFYYLDMLKAAGLDALPVPPRLFLLDDEMAAAEQTLAGYGVLPTDRIIGINPGAQYGIAKRWKPERFGEVASRMSAETGARVVIFGGPGDLQTAAAVEASMTQPAVNLAGKTTIRSVMALIKRCGLFITNDSGPMHVAAALGVPTLAIFGSTDEIATGPFGPGNRIIKDPVPCSPCLKRTCPKGHYDCLERISAEWVYQEAREMWGG